MEITKIRIGDYDDSFFKELSIGGYFIKAITPAFIYAVTYRGETILGQDLKACIEACYDASTNANR